MLSDSHETPVERVGLDGAPRGRQQNVDEGAPADENDALVRRQTDSAELSRGLDGTRIQYFMTALWPAMFRTH